MKDISRVHQRSEHLRMMGKERKEERGQKGGKEGRRKKYMGIYSENPD